MCTRQRSGQAATVHAFAGIHQQSHGQSGIAAFESHDLLTDSLVLHLEVTFDETRWHSIRRGDRHIQLPQLEIDPIVDPQARRLSVSSRQFQTIAIQHDDFEAVRTERITKIHRRSERRTLQSRCLGAVDEQDNLGDTFTDDFDFHRHTTQSRLASRGRAKEDQCPPRGVFRNRLRRRSRWRHPYQRQEDCPKPGPTHSDESPVAWVTATANRGSLTLTLAAS